MAPSCQGKKRIHHLTDKSRARAPQSRRQLEQRGIWPPSRGSTERTPGRRQEQRVGGLLAPASPLGEHRDSPSCPTRTASKALLWSCTISSNSPPVIPLSASAPKIPIPASALPLLLCEFPICEMGMTILPPFPHRLLLRTDQAVLSEAPGWGP